MINPAINLLVWSIAIFLTAYGIVATVYDLKYREIPKYFWYPLWAFCAPITIFLYVIGYYPWYLLALTASSIAMYFALLLDGYYQGADFWYLASVSLFLVENPLNGNVLMPVTFFIWLLALTVSFAVVFLVVQKVFKKDIIEDATRFPAMVIITLALILTLVMV